MSVSLQRTVTPMEPCRIEGSIIHGFRRGTTVLGIPTANICTDGIEDVINAFKHGPYYGWACVNHEVYKMVVNIGFNPSFNNDKKSVEVMIMHHFEEDFYGKPLKIIILGSIREEFKFQTLEELKEAILDDMEIAKDLLEKPQNICFKEDSFFK